MLLPTTSGTSARESTATKATTETATTEGTWVEGQGFGAGGRVTDGAYGWGGAAGPVAFNGKLLLQARWGNSGAGLELDADGFRMAGAEGPSGISVDERLDVIVPARAYREGGRYFLGNLATTV